MTHKQYEQHKQRLEGQLRAGIQLLETAHQAQVRALELVWMLQAEAGGGLEEALAAPEPAPMPSPPKEEMPEPPSPPRRRTMGDLEHDIRAALPGLPETLTRRDVCEAIGYEPNRGSLYRILQELVQEGSLLLEFRGEGQKPAVYRKTGAHAAPGAG